MEDLMKGKRGLIMGIANDHSIAWGMAKTLLPMAPSLPSPIRARPRASASSRWCSRSVSTWCCLATSRTSPASIACSRRCARSGASSTFVIHAIGFADKNELKGRYADTRRENFSRTMVISCFSFTEVAKRAAELMTRRAAA